MKEQIDSRGRPWTRFLLVIFIAGLWNACGEEGSTNPPTDPPPDTTTPPAPPVDTATPPPPPPPLPSSSAVAIVGVDVVTMVGDQLLTDQTVLVEDAVIQAVGDAASVEVPQDALVVDGDDLFLMPGLADMHTHVSVITSFSQVPDPDQAEHQGILNVANGVTTILNMGDYERHDLIGLRNQWIAGDELGPTMLVGKFIRGQQDSGTPNEIATTETRARELVDRAWTLDYDFIKVYSRISIGIHTATADQASKRDLPVFGHLPIGRSLSGSLAAQSMVAHIGQYFSTHYNSQTNSSFTPSAISTTLQADAWVTTTLTANESFRAAWGNHIERFNEFLQRPGVRATHPEIIQRWRWWLGQGGQPGQLDFQMPFFLEMTRDFAQGGVPMLLGTDAPELPGLPSGFAVHTELGLLVDAGLTPAEALATGTEAPGRFVREHFPEQRPFGTVEVGKRGDLILLRANPLLDVGAAQDRVGVMVRGVWYSQDVLDAKVDSLAALYGN